MDRQDEENHERLRNALWYAVGKIVDAETAQSGMNATPQFIGALVSTVLAQIESMASDLTSFASHAGRSTVTVDDVLLLARRNDDLADMLRAYLEKLRADKEADEGRNAGRAGAMSRVGGSGTAAGRGRGTGRA